MLTSNKSDEAQKLLRQHGPLRGHAHHFNWAHYRLEFMSLKEQILYILSIAFAYLIMLLVVWGIAQIMMSPLP